MAQAYKNSPKMKVHMNSFIGGQTLDYKYGIANSFYQSQALDFRQKASQMSVLPGMRNIANNLPDLPTAILQTPDGVRYAAGNAGYLYRISTTNVVSVIAQMGTNGAAGIAYNQQSDNIYASDQQTVNIYGQILAGNPTFRKANFGPSASVANAVIYIFDTASLSYDGNTDSNTNLTTQRNNLNTLTATGVTPSNYSNLVTNTLTNTYLVSSTTINEITGNFSPFIPDIEPMYGIAVYVTNIGSGSLILTMHDSLNNNLGAVTITNGNLVLGWNMFKFASPGIRAIINPIANGTGEGYHFHLTSSSAGDTTTVATIAPNDLTGCNFVYFAHRMIKTNNGWHPMTNFNQYLCIANGPYLSTYNYANDANPNNTQWVRHQLQTDFGYEGCALSVNNQSLVMAAEKRSGSATRNYQDGYLYFWDGISSSWVSKIQIPMGSPYSVKTFNNVTYFYCAGSLFAWGGGQQVIKVRYMAYQNTDYLGAVDSTIVNPQMMAIRYNLLMLGYPSTTTNINVNYGIYSWGAVEMTYPNSFGYSYEGSDQILNYTSANNLQIGLVENFVDSMYMSWSYEDSNSVTHNGLDVVDNFSTAAPNYSWTSLIWDGGVRYKTKRAYRFRVNFLPLPAGCTLTAQYSLDRGTFISADPTSNNPYTANVGDTALTVEMNEARFKEIQFGFFGTCTAASTPPTITGVTLELDPLETEVSLRHTVDG